MKRAWLPASIFVLTVGQLLLATLGPDLEQFEGKAFGWRLATFAPGMLVAPAVWWWLRRGSGEKPPFGAFALVMGPFFFDVTSNSLNLYDSIWWFDDLAHVITWFLLSAGIGMLVVPRDLSGWLAVALVTGIGAVLAIGYELAEWYTFIRHGTNDDKDSYTDTLGDEALGLLGAVAAGLLVLRVRRSR